MSVEKTESKGRLRDWRMLMMWKDTCNESKVMRELNNEIFGPQKR